MFKSKVKFLSVMFMLSTVFVLSAGCKKKGEASCKGIWDKFHSCLSDKEKKQIKGLLGTKDEFMKRCDKVKDNDAVKNIMKAAAGSCDDFKSSFGKNKKAMLMLSTLGDKLKGLKKNMKNMKKKAKDTKKKVEKKKVEKKKVEKKEDKKEEKKEEKKK